jgi:predicted amidohydrolase YtcJ
MKTCCTIALFALAIASPLQAEPPADLVFTNGAVYTVDAARSWASALAVTGERISYVGEDAVANSFVGPATRVVDLNGRMLLPGFQDSHVHPGMVADPANSVKLDGIMRSEDVLERIRRFARAHPDAAWIEGGGWDEGAFLAAALDEMKRLGITALEELKHSI